MGNLYQRKNSKFWWFSTTINGKLVRISTKKTNKNDGRIQMNIMERELLSKNGGEKKDYHQYTLQDVFDLYIEDCEERGDVKDSSLVSIRNRIMRLSLFFDTSMKSTEMNRGLIEKYIRKRRKVDGVENSTINSELGCLRSSYYSMIDKERLPETMKSKVRFKHLKENIRKDFLEKWELDVLLQNTTYDYLKYIILFGWYTGCRKGEILNLRWSQINIHDGMVNLKETKSGIRRSIPLVDELREYFEQKYNELNEKGKFNQNDVVWTKKNGSRIKTIDYQWKTSCIRSKLVDENGRWKKFHCLRRSFVRNSIKSGVSEKIICSIGGWETNSVFQRYNIVNEQDLIDGMKLINQKLSSMKTMEDVSINESPKSQQNKVDNPYDELRKEMKLLNKKISSLQNVEKNE